MSSKLRLRADVNEVFCPSRLNLGAHTHRREHALGRWTKKDVTIAERGYYRQTRYQVASVLLQWTFCQ